VKDVSNSNNSEQLFDDDQGHEISSDNDFKINQHLQ